MNNLGPVHRKLKRKPVTLIVGIICADGIVVASDSQTTWGTGKSWSANKMVDLHSKSGHVLVAESGATVTSTPWIDDLEKLALEGSDSGDLPSLVEVAARRVRENLRSQHFGCSASELMDLIMQNELESALMVAHYKNSIPQLHTVSFRLGIAQRSKMFYEAIGSGSDLASHLLSELCLPNSESAYSAACAALIVEIVKRHDPYCGGPTKLGVLRDPSLGATQPVILSPDETNQIVNSVLDAEKVNRENRAEVLRGYIEQFKAAEKMKKYLEIPGEITEAD